VPPEGGDNRKDAFIAAYGVSPVGNFEGKNILESVGDMDQRPALAEARRKLLETCDIGTWSLREG
jgi:hypothetical protein